MSNETEIVNVYGPKPRPDNTRLTGIGIDPDTGEVWQAVRGPKDLKTDYSMTEAMLFERMNMFNQFTRSGLHDDPEFVADMRTEANIMHYGLASVQRVKIREGKNLDVPLTPHPDVEMNLPKPRGVTTPELG